MSAVKAKIAQAQTLNVLLKQATETYTASATFMKQLTTIAVSTVTYLQNAFNAENYDVELFSNLRLHILKKKCKDENAQFVSTSLSRAFDAFEKKYLQKLALCFYDGNASNAEDLMEYIVFEYDYTEDGVCMDVTTGAGASEQKISMQSVRSLTERLVRRCLVITDATVALPDNCDISLRLYYNDAAPEGYQAPGFYSVLEKMDHLGSPRAELGARLGEVRTAFHGLAAEINVRTLYSSIAPEPSQNAPMIEDYEVGVVNEDSGLERRVRCPCRLTDQDEELMLACNSCGMLQHGACFGRESAPSCHLCSECARAPGLGVDRMLLNCDRTEQKSLCKLRRVLHGLRRVAVCHFGDVSARLRLTPDRADQLFASLHHHRVIEHNNQRCESAKVLPDGLEAMIRKYFYLEEVSDPEPRDASFDDTFLCKFIDPPSKKPIKEDDTMLQYKAAILSTHNTEEDLPLSGDHNPVKDMDKIGKGTVKRKAGKENVRVGATVKSKRAKKSLKDD